MQVAQKLGLGDMVWWNLPDSIKYTKAEWAHRYPQFPLPNDPLGHCLRRALFSINAPKRAKRLIRPLRERDRWGLVIETPGLDDLIYRVEMIVRLDPLGLSFVRHPDNLDYADQLQRNFTAELQRVTPAKVADLVLSHVRGRCLAVTSRKNGGVYFVPTDKADSLDEIEALVDDLGGSLVRIPVLDNTRAKTDLIKLVVEDLKGSIETARNSLSARHKADALQEATQALDRMKYYHDALELAADYAKSTSQQLNDLIAESMLGKRGEQ
jgi:hypothetical protein